MDDEITLSGSPKVNPASFSFSNYSTSAQVSDNQFFQYRVLMEAEDNTACSGETEACLPELTSVEVAPTGRYYGGSPVIRNNTTASFRELYSITTSSNNACVKYQLSTDSKGSGTYFYWHDGDGEWKAATDEVVSQSTSSDDTNAHLSTFINTLRVGAGYFFWKAFLESDTSQSCELDEISITGSQ